MVAVDHVQRAGWTEPLNREFAFDKIVSAARAVARVGVEVRPLARALEWFARLNAFLIEREKRDAAGGAQYAADFVALVRVYFTLLSGPNTRRLDAICSTFAWPDPACVQRRWRCTQSL